MRCSPMRRTGMARDSGGGQLVRALVRAAVVSVEILSLLISCGTAVLFSGGSAGDNHMRARSVKSHILRAQMSVPFCCGTA